MVQIGDTYTHEFSICQEQVNEFAKISGDNNPIHLDAEYAAMTVFKKPIVHGMFATSIISSVLGTKFPGHGSVYLKQTVEFLRPLFPDVEYVGLFTVISIDAKNRATIETKVNNKVTGKICIQGEAFLVLPA